ncbi:MAG: hypothetical protein ABSD74_15540 [Rhizomicrobium sp.]|jgi:hypothetical protein
MKAALISLPGIAAVLAGSAALGDPSIADMTKTVDGFYRAYQSFRPPDGVPDANTRKRFEPFITPQLDRLLSDVSDAQSNYEETTKGQFPPLIDGDPFTPNYEGATSYSIDVCGTDARGAHCSVSLSFQSGRDKARTWTDTVWLVRMADGWRVNDIEFGANGDQGSKGRLSETLRSAIDHGHGVKQ